MSRYIALYLTFAAGLIHATPLSSQTPVPLDTLLVQVQSRASTLAVLGRSVEVLNSEHLRALPASTVVEALRWGFGVDLMPRSPALVDVAVRGSSFEQVLVLVDGVRVRDAQTGHFNLNLSVPLDQVERVELLRGPASSLYGSDAMGGVINIVTKRSGPSRSVRAAYGSFQTADVAASIANEIGGRVHFDAAASHQRSDGHRVGTDYELTQGRLAATLPLATGTLQTDGGYSRRDFGADGFYGPYPSFEATETFNLAARWRPNEGARLPVEPTIAFRRNTDDYILYRDDPARYRNLHTTDQVTSDVIASFGIGSSLSGAAGAHATYDWISSTALGDHSEWTAAGSLEMVGAVRGVSGTAGARLDRLTSGEVELSPALSLSADVMNALTIRGAAGRSFRAPTWTERYYRDPANVGNPDLQPEDAWSAEVGADISVGSLGRINATAFHRSAEDLIDWAKPISTPSEPWVTRNVDSAEFTGLEAQIGLPRLAGVVAELRGYWISVESSAAAGLQSKYALRPLVESYSLALTRTFDVFEGSARAARERRSGEDAYTVADLRLGVSLNAIRIFVDGKNVLDESYRDIAANPAPGRSISLGVEWRSF